MSENIIPATREEVYLDVIRRLAEGETVDVGNLIEPVTRVERYLYDICKAYTEPNTQVEPVTITENGTTTAPGGKAYSPITTNVPNSYAAGDEGKVVSSGALAAQTAYPSTVTENGTIDTTTHNSVTVDVVKVDVYSGTLDAPFKSAWLTALGTALKQYQVTAIMTIDATALGLGTYSDIPSIQGIQDESICFEAVDPTTAGSGRLDSFFIGYSSQGVLQTALSYVGGTLTDMSQYASLITTQVVIITHPWDDE